MPLEQGTRSFSLVHLPQRSTLQLAHQSFILDCQSRALSPQTIAFYRKKLKPFLAFLARQNVTEPTDITAAHLRAYFVELQQSHNPGGLHACFRAVRTLLRFWQREGDLSENPLANFRAPRLPKPLLEPVPLPDVAKMLAACKGDRLAVRDAAMMLALLDSGLRASELLALDVGDLDIASGRVLIRHGKGDKGRVVFLGAKARKAILKMLKTRTDVAPTSPLWLTDDGERLTYWGLRQMLRRRAHDAHVPAPSAHDFRRAFALLSLRGGCDVYALQKLMGHADLTVLRRYLAQTEQDLAAAHAKSSPVDRML